MQNESTITKIRMLVIPKESREQIGAKVLDNLEVIIEKGSVFLIKTEEENPSLTRTFQERRELALTNPNAKIIRTIDQMGKILLPKKAWDALECEVATQISFNVEGDKIVLTKDF